MPLALQRSLQVTSIMNRQISSVLLLLVALISPNQSRPSRSALIVFYRLRMLAIKLCFE